MSVAEEIRHQSRPKVAGRVDGIARLPSETSADAKDDEEQAQRRQVPGADVAAVLERIDKEHEEGACDELGEELSRRRHEGGRVGAEDAGRGGFGISRDGAEMGAAFVDVDGG